MIESEDEKRQKKIKRDAKDKIEREDEYSDKPPRGRHEKDSLDKNDEY